MVQVGKAVLIDVFGPRGAPIAASFEARGREALKRAEIDASERRLAYFLAQMAHEAGARASLEENLRYTTVDALLRAFGRRIPRDRARDYLRNPEALANLVYARADLGNTQPGDGWRFHGRGLIQLTGRANYRAVAGATGLPLEARPEMAADPAHAWDVAAGFFAVNRLNRFADAGDFDGLSRAINGGENGLAERRAQLRRVQAILKR